MRFVEAGQGGRVSLRDFGGNLEGVHHVFEKSEVDALNAALASQRPLLIRGEPGTGKSQLAKAAAVCLGRAFVSFAVDSQTEPHDLLWYFDAVGRLAEAQVAGAEKALRRSARHRVAIRRFLRPGPLWWAFDWSGARRQAEGASVPEPFVRPGVDPHQQGCVVLIDEIDKAETEVPNGLLEALGEGRFTPFGLSRPVVACAAVPPLVVITTNEERSMPDAFLRRCMVLRLRLPSSVDALVEFFMVRGRAHFPGASEEILRQAASQVAEDRVQAVENGWMPRPGVAEYIDLLRALMTYAPNDPGKQEHFLKDIAEYALKKHPQDT